MCFQILILGKISQNMTGNGHFYKKLPLITKHAFLNHQNMDEVSFFGRPSFRNDLSGLFSRFQKV